MRQDMSSEVSIQLEKHNHLAIDIVGPLPVKREFGEGGSEIEYKITIDPNEMIESNFRLSEAEAYAGKYENAFLRHLKLPEGCSIEGCSIGGSSMRDDEDEGKHKMLEQQCFKVSSSLKWNDKKERDAEKGLVFTAFENAHASAIKEIGDPELHGSDGKPLAAPKFESGEKTDWIVGVGAGLVG